VRNKQPLSPASATALVAQVVQPLQAILDVRVVRALKAAIIAVASGADLMLTSIGRRLLGGTVKHHIRRVDRLLLKCFAQRAVRRMLDSRQQRAAATVRSQPKVSDTLYDNE
jgi:hypothetical protein